MVFHDRSPLCDFPLLYSKVRPTVWLSGSGGTGETRVTSQPRLRAACLWAGESRPSAGAGVRRFCVVQESPPEERYHRKLDKIFTHNSIFSNDKKTQPAKMPSARCIPD